MDFDKACLTLWILLCWRHYVFCLAWKHLEEGEGEVLLGRGMSGGHCDTATTPQSCGLDEPKKINGIMSLRMWKKRETRVRIKDLRIINSLLPPI